MGDFDCLRDLFRERGRDRDRDRDRDDSRRRRDDPRRRRRERERERDRFRSNDGIGPAKPKGPAVNHPWSLSTRTPRAASSAPTRQKSSLSATFRANL